MAGWVVDLRRKREGDRGGNGGQRACCRRGVGRAGAGRNMGVGDRRRERRGFLGGARGDRQRETQDSPKDEEREAGMAFGFGRKTKRERKRQAREFGDIEREMWDVREKVMGVKLC
jgi:hypothetical protein